MHYSTEQRSNICKRLWIFFSFSENMGKNISKYLSSKYSRKRLYHAKKSTTDALRNYFKKNNSKNSRSNWSFDW